MAERSYNGRNLYTTQIDSLVTGDVAITASGGMESSNNSGWYFIESANATSAEFDSSEKRTGSYTLKISTLDALGKCSCFYGDSSTLFIKVKPNSTYRVRMYAKTNNAALNSVYCGFTEYSSRGGQFLRNTNTNKLSGTNDWTLLETTVTTHQRTNTLFLYCQNAVAGNISDAWFDINSLEITEVLPDRTTATSRLAVRDMGTALRFDGTDDYVEVPDAGLPASTFQNGFTLSAWIRPLGIGEGGVGRIFDKSSGASGSAGFEYRMRNATPTGVNIRVNGGTQINAAVNFQNFRQPWVHVLVTVAANATVTHYINGVVSGAPATTGALSGITTTNALSIGNRATATDSTFDGIIDEPRVWNRVLTAQEVSDLYLYNNVPRSGLVAEYLFNEGSGSTANDSSGNGNDGTISGATYTEDVPLKPRVSVRDMGTALKSTAVNHYVSLGTQINDEINTAQAFTVSQWVRRNTRSSLQSFMGVPAGDKFWFNFDSDNAVRMYQQDLTPAFIKTNAKITDTEWHHLVGTFNGTARQIYIDGIAQSYTATNASTGTLNLNNTFYLVAFPTGNNFIGTVDEPRIWNRALTADEVLNLYLHNSVPQDGLVAEYLFDEASGTTAIDSSGNGNDGTITGATYTLEVPLEPRASI